MLVTNAGPQNRRLRENYFAMAPISAAVSRWAGWGLGGESELGEERLC
jgi:hypothetical protein